MTTIARQASQDSFNDAVRNDRDAYLIVQDYKNKLHQGYYDSAPHHFQSVFIQKYMPIDEVDAYMFARMWQWFCIGAIMIHEIEIGYEPVSDDRISEMNDILQRLPSGYSAKFWGGKADCDGWIKSSSPLMLPDNLNGGMYYHNMQFRLEVGYCMPETVYLHLAFAQCVARWPYGSKHITLLVLHHKIWDSIWNSAEWSIGN